MKIEENTVVSIHYTLTNDAGQRLDSSEGRQPLAYLHGKGQIIPGLERALEGKKAGDQIEVAIAPAEGYGERNEGLVCQVERSKFGDAARVEVGMTFQARTPDGGSGAVRVVGVEGDVVTVDANHPLAGETLNFDVTVDAVRNATKEELEHGHAHGPDGHHHH